MTELQSSLHLDTPHVEDAPRHEEIETANDRKARLTEVSWRALLDLRDDLTNRCRNYAKAYGDHTLRIGVSCDLRDVAKDIVSDLVARASEAFGFAGQKISIPTHDIAERFLSEFDAAWRRDRESNPRAFSPQAVWDYLRATYEKSGHEQALVEAAELIVREFPFARDERIRRARGLVIFECCLYGEPRQSWRSGHGKYQMHYDCRLPTTLRALGVFLAWHAGSTGLPPPVAADVNAFTQWMHDNDRGYDSRETKTIGPIVLQFFKRAVEWKFPEALAARLNLFLSQYGAEALHAKLR